MSESTKTQDDVVITSSQLRGWPPPDPNGDKETRGRVLVVGGHATTPGAVLLAAEAALRGGAGKLQCAVPGTIAVPLAMAVPEAGVASLPVDDGGDIAVSAAEEIVELAKDCAAVLLGPGIVSPRAASALLEKVVPQLDVPVVIDALGMAYLTDHLDGVAHLEGKAVLSPNVGELSQTLGEDHEDDPRAGAAELARRTGATVASGTAMTWIVTPDGRSWRDEGGSPGLGVSGSGDVKAGAIAGLLARGADPEQAACWATYAHGRAGERLAAQVGSTGFLARELLREIPAVLAELA
ncbi:NAD(P)H-hydrate dehydratase [Mobilicoccus pelagius]|nr:NAD(P)H-hydrate dehydratase [Mobilicoccus pelagius]